MNRLIGATLMAAMIWIGCENKPAGKEQFRLLRKADTGLDFENTPVQNGAFNVLKYMYFFNGGGVAAGLVPAPRAAVSTFALSPVVATAGAAP